MVPQNIDSVTLTNTIAPKAIEVTSELVAKKKDTLTSKKVGDVSKKALKITIKSDTSIASQNISAIDSSAMQARPINHKIIVPYAASPLKVSESIQKIILPIDTIPKGLKLVAISNIPAKALKVNTHFVKSQFTGHLLKAKNNEPRLRNVENNNWFSLQLLIAFFILASLRTFYGKRLKLVIDAFLNQRYASQFFREENALIQRTSVLLSLTFIISASLFFYQLESLYPLQWIEFKGFQKYLLILVFTLLFYIFKILFNKIGGFLFKCERETSEYIFNQFLILQIIGLGLMLIVLILRYQQIIPSNYILYAGLFILLAGFIIRIFRSFQITTSNTGFSYIYIFLYLCTLEIIPIVVIVKYVTS